MKTISALSGINLGALGGIPEMRFHSEVIRGKRRLIGNPNGPMRELHASFERLIKQALRSCGSDGRSILKFASATGCVPGSNSLKNAQQHRMGRFFYITDLKNAYPSLDLERLVLLIVRIVKHVEYSDEVSLKFFSMGMYDAVIREDALFGEILALLQVYFSGSYGRGLAVGGPSSPFLLNLYCEVFLDTPIRRLFEKQGTQNIVYTRYVDDMVISSNVFISTEQRQAIRRCITEAGFQVHHRKSQVLALSMGTVFVTKTGLSQQPGLSVARLVFPQKKRRHLHRVIHDYLAQRTDWPEKVSGYIAEFLYYYKAVGVKTATDRKTFALCRCFEKLWAMNREGPVPWARLRRR